MTEYEPIVRAVVQIGIVAGTIYAIFREYPKGEK